MSRERHLRMSARTLPLVAVLLLWSLFLPGLGNALAEDNMQTYLCEDNTVGDMVNHPNLAAFGRHLLPGTQAPMDLPLRHVGRLMPWHSHVQPGVVLDAVNRIIADEASGKRVFFSFHTDAAKRAATGLFFFRGRKGAPFALICPGGGFAYVGSLHEGFPLALDLSRRGYNALVLQYRTGGEERACEDMVAALAWIFDHAKDFGVETRGYSVWGSSAGARMAADLGSYGSARLGGRLLPGPSLVVTAYTGHSRWTHNDPPTYAVVSMDDPIASPRGMQQRIEALQQAGTEARIRFFHNAGHGFGTGKGTDAEGWMDGAVQFWEEQVQKEKTGGDR